MAFASLLPSLSSARGLKYDVFLSFSDSDTRKGIASELHRLLTQREIKTYMDANLQVGDAISLAPLAAIEESRFAIIIRQTMLRLLSVCSKLQRSVNAWNTTTEFCHSFLMLILMKKDCRRGVFNKLSPTMIALGYTEKLQEWKDALTKVANFSGWDLKNFKTERELVKKIVEDICNKVQPIENNKRELEATIEAKNKAHVPSGVNVSGGYISDDNVNLGKQGDVVKGVRGDFVKGVHGDFIKGVRSDYIKGDRGGDGCDSNNGGFAGAGGPARGNNTFNYGNK